MYIVQYPFYYVSHVFGLNVFCYEFVSFLQKLLLTRIMMILDFVK